MVLVFVCVAGAITPVSAAPGGTSPDQRSASADTTMRPFTRGAFMAMKGEYWGAIDSYRKAMTGRPDKDAAVHFSIARAFHNLSVPDSSRVHGEAAVRLDPSNIHYSVFLARLAHDMQDYPRSAELYGKAFLADSSRTDILYLQALEYVAANRPAEALGVYERLLARDPSDERYLSQTLWLQVALKRYPDAIVTLKRLISLVGPREKLQLTLGELYEQTGQGEQAVPVYREIIGRDSRSAAAWVALVDHYIRSGELELAAREFSAFDALQPKGSAQAIDMVKLFVTRAEKDSAYVQPVFRMLDALVARHPRDGRVYVLKGVFEMRRDASERAISSFETAVRFDAGNVDAWENLVMALLEKGESRRAFDVIGRSRRALPHEKYRLDILQGYALLKSGSPAKAAGMLEQVVRLAQKPKHHELLIQAYSTLAMAYDELGRRRLGMDAYGKVLELDPHNALAMNNLAYLYAEDGTMLPKALRLAQNAVLFDPENPVFLDTLGWVQFRLGNYAAARDLLEKAVATGIGEAEIYLHLGSVYEKLGDAQKAKEMFDRAKAAGKKP